MARGRALVVDDTRSWRNINENALEEAGFEVHTFSTLVAAKQAALGIDFDLFVVDGTIDAEMDGVNWVTELRDEGECVVLCSGFIPRDMRRAPHLDKATLTKRSFMALLDTLV